jgi:uroporphyrinogen decarboxylase
MMNMNKWFEDMIACEKKPAMPILSFPAAKMMGVSVDELVNSGDLQAQGVKLITETYHVAAAQAYMNLSAEAEAFGAQCIHSENEVPTIVGQLISTPEEADALELPAIGTKQTGPILDGLKKARKLVEGTPFFAECIGPFSLAGRLMDVNEIMVNCYDEPEMVETIMQKTTKYLIGWMNECKKAGCDGVIMAEPLTGVLSPSLAREFSHPYVKELVDAVQDENFSVIYHNCGNETVHMRDDIYDLGCKAYHFGDSVDMKVMLEKAPEDVLVMGNISPAVVFVAGTPEEIREATLKLMDECGDNKNFWISSGCDVPPQTEPANIKAFFDAVDEYYGR